MEDWMVRAITLFTLSFLMIVIYLIIKRFSSKGEVKAVRKKLSAGEKVTLLIAVIVIIAVSLIRMLDPGHSRGNGPFSEWLREFFGLYN